MADAMAHLVGDEGEVLAQGTYEQVRNDERVITAYLGEDSHA